MPKRYFRGKIGNTVRRLFLVAWLSSAAPFCALADGETPSVPMTDSVPDIAAALARQPIDTVPSDDKFTKIILFSDKTWDYLDLGRPSIDESLMDSAFWGSDKIHAYKELTLNDLPDEIDLLLADSLHPFCAPVVGAVTSRYMFRGRREHRGTDIRLAVGDTVRAAFDGRVRISEYSSRTGGYGNLIVARHPNGLETYYGHLSKRFVEVGEVVKAGEPIGLGGNTGRSTGAHLHFETRYRGQNFDPERVVDFATGGLRDTMLTLRKHHFSIYSHHGMTDEESLAASQRIVHTIRSGDTLSGLAAKYGTTVSKICKLNNMSAKATLRVGKRLVVR